MIITYRYFNIRSGDKHQSTQQKMAILKIHNNIGFLKNMKANHRKIANNWLEML